MNAEAANIHR